MTPLMKEAYDALVKRVEVRGEGFDHDPQTNEIFNVKDGWGMCSIPNAQHYFKGTPKQWRSALSALARAGLYRIHGEQTSRQAMDYDGWVKLGQ